MKTFRFKDFVIYRDARRFRTLVRTMLESFPISEQFRLSDQIFRSSLSVLLNIAEGSAKGSDKDFARYLDISIASLNETIAGFDAASDDHLLTAANLRVIELEGEQLAKRIGSFIQRLRSSQQPRAKSQKPKAKSQKPKANSQ